MAKLRYVTIEKDGLQGECTPEALKAWQRNGWTVVDDGSEKEEAPQPPAEPKVSAQSPGRQVPSAPADEKKENG